MNDPILEMTELEIREACLNLVGYPSCAQPLYPYHNLVGLIIAKLQEWGCYFKWNPDCPKAYWFVDKEESCQFVNPSLQICFLRTAQALGHYKIKPPVRELSLEERVCQLEGQMKNLLPDLQ